jgi:hypothetical protein
MVAVSSRDPLEAQRRYARVLAVLGRAVGAMLVLAFAAYALHWLPSYVPIERLPELWHLSAADFLRAAHVPSGWRGWLLLGRYSDMLVLCVLAILISLTTLCLFVAIAVFRRDGERALAWICLAQIAVVVVTASGMITR